MTQGIEEAGVRPARSGGPLPSVPRTSWGRWHHITEEKRRAALASVREGRLYDLGRVLDEQVPVFPGRHFRQTLVTPTTPPRCARVCPPQGSATTM